MTKKVRMSLYVLSLVLTTAVLILLIFNEKIIKTSGTENQLVQEQTQSEVTEQPTETETEINPEDTQKEMETQTEEQSESEPTTLLFSGDIYMTDKLVARYGTEGISAYMSDEILSEMTGVDIFMANHEFPFSTRGTPMEGKKYTFRTNPENVQILKDMGVDIVTLANNHTLDFGTVALQDTFQTLDGAGILYAGAGDTKERAEALQIIEVNGQKFGFLAATRVIPVTNWNVEYRQPGLFTTYDDTRLVECIKAAKEECDFLTVYVHWGVERVAYPEEYQKVMARHFVEAGADLIIGSHPHVLQGIEFIEEKPVFYSLGNYAFYQALEKTALVKVTVWPDGDVEYDLVPVSVVQGKNELLQGEKASAIYTYMNEISIRDYVDGTGKVRDVE